MDRKWQQVDLWAVKRHDKLVADALLCIAICLYVCQWPVLQSDITILTPIFFMSLSWTLQEKFSKLTCKKNLWTLKHFDLSPSKGKSFTSTKENFPLCSTHQWNMNTHSKIFAQFCIILNFSQKNISTLFSAREKATACQSQIAYFPVKC